MKLWKPLLALVGAVAAAAPATAQDRPDIVVAVPGIYRTMEPIEGASPQVIAAS